MFATYEVCSVPRILHFFNLAPPIFYLTPRIFYLAYRIFISHFLSHISHFLPSISDFYLASRFFLSRISHFLFRNSYFLPRMSHFSNLAWIFKHHPEFISNLACLLQTSAHASWTLTSCAAYPSHLRIIGWEHLNKRRRIFLFLLKLGCCLKNIIPQKKEYSPSTLQTFDKLKER